MTWRFMTQSVVAESFCFSLITAVCPELLWWILAQGNLDIEGLALITKSVLIAKYSSYCVCYIGGCIGQIGVHQLKFFEHQWMASPLLFSTLTCDGPMA